MVESKTEEPTVSIDLKMPAFIPGHYIENTRVRFNIYQRLVKINEPYEVNDMALELIDRFGETPEEVANLLYMVELRKLAQKAGVESIFREGETVTISLRNDNEINLNLGTATWHKSVRIGSRQIKLDIQAAGEGWKMILKELLRELSSPRAER